MLKQLKRQAWVQGCVQDLLKESLGNVGGHILGSATVRLVCFLGKQTKAFVDWRGRDYLILSAISACSSTAAILFFHFWYNDIYDSKLQARKTMKVLSPLLKSRTADLHFLPPEFAALEPSAGGVYTFSAGVSSPDLMYRASSDTQGLWEWSYDGVEWHPTDELNRGDGEGTIPDAPTSIFITRLHLEHLIRKAKAGEAQDEPRQPPPLSSGGSVQPLDDAPECLCCPISQQVMLQPVVLPSGQTFDLPSLRRWMATNPTDPTTGAPICSGDLYPNLALRDIIQRWLTQQPASGDSSSSAGAAASHMIDLSSPC